MHTLKTWALRLTLLGAATFIGWTFVLTLRAEAADHPRPGERERASQVLTRPDDAREPLPPSAFISGHGVVEPKDREVKLGSQVPGLVARVAVQEGQRVEPGAVLFELVGEPERADVRARKADLEVAKARAALSASNAARVIRLEARGAATMEELERARSQAEIDAASQLQAEGRLAEARARLERLTIRAPSAGTVLRVMVREGEYYNPAAGALATLADLSVIRVRMDVDERQVGKVQVGQSGYVTARAFGERRFAGRVVELARRMGRKTVRTDEPTERIDTTVREVVLQLDDGAELLQGLRVIAFIEAPPRASASAGAAR